MERTIEETEIWRGIWTANVDGAITRMKLSSSIWTNSLNLHSIHKRPWTINQSLQQIQKLNYLFINQTQDFKNKKQNFKKNEEQDF